MEKVKKSKLRKWCKCREAATGDTLKKNFSKTGWNGVRYNYVLYLFVTIWYYYICILSRCCHTKVFLKTAFLKVLQNSQENTCTGVSFLSAGSNFINEETLAQCFPDCKFRLGSKYVSVYLLAKVHRISTKRSTKSFFCKTQWEIKNCYHVILAQNIHNPKR